MKKLEGKVALITGAAVGLGKGIATVYAKYGSKMCLVDLLPEVEETAKELRETYGAEVLTYVQQRPYERSSQEGKRRLWGSERGLL